ncbi:tRNA pseudouridine(38-40) synthase TruA [Brevibacterium daeguense]|uniref:tRNA pseudouridine synthase A n=1 Tax=Brevibacterium daeguense TaxID=909936 RepID=A0ABP8EG11_9MICO
MTRFRVDLGYRGTGFHGWAVQPGLRTVQGCLESALETVCGEPIRTIVAGRTDSGVHARRQVVHLDLSAEAVARLIGRADREPGAALVSRLRGALRHLGCPDIVIHSAQTVSADFDARFSAIWREYTYRVADDDTFLDPLAVERTTIQRGRLDHDAMAKAAGELLGLHDFLPFCRPRPEGTTIRTLFVLDVDRDADAAILLRLRADAFCHHMVRATIGGLVKVGAGSWPVSRPAELIALAEGGAADVGPMHVMPPQGLVLEAVGYPDAGEWAQRAERTRARRLGVDA